MLTLFSFKQKWLKMKKFASLQKSLTSHFDCTPFLEGPQMSRCTRTPGVLICTPIYPPVPPCTGVRLWQLLDTWLGVYKASGTIPPLCCLQRWTPGYSLLTPLPTHFGLGRIGGHRRKVETSERPAGEEVGMGQEGWRPLGHLPCSSLPSSVQGQ